MNVKNLFSKKRVIYGVIGLVIIGTAGYFLFFNKNNTEQTVTVHPADFLQQVSVSGTVTAAQNLDLSFEQQGLVNSVLVKVGDTVRPGQLLAAQNTSEFSSQLAEMQAGIDLQKAKLQQLLAGNSPQYIASIKTSADNARQSLIYSLQDAYTKSNDAILNKTDQMFSNPQSSIAELNISTVQSQLKTQININRVSIGIMLSIWNISLQNINDTTDLLDSINSANKNLAQISSFLDNLSTIVNNPSSCVYTTQLCPAIPTTWKSDLSIAQTNVNTAKSNIISAGNASKSANNQLVLAQAPVRESDIAVYQAQITQAVAQEQGVFAQINKKRIYSPIHGIITGVNSKIGNVFSSGQAAISVISKNDFQIESYVPEINVALVQVNQSAQVILDAYPQNPFGAKVISIDPAQTVKNGVSTYKVNLEFTDAFDKRIKSGMTGNVIMTTLKKSNVISIPQGVVKVDNGQKFVTVKNGDTTSQINVETGSVASNGNIEITSGLKEGDIIILK